MPDLTEQILAAVGPQVLQAAQAQGAGPQARRAAEALRRASAASSATWSARAASQFGKNHTIRPAGQHGTVAGVYRRTSTGLGFVRPHVVEGKGGADVAVREDDALDAATGDEVLVKC